jgi:hypothetical protein
MTGAGLFRQGSRAMYQKLHRELNAVTTSVCREIAGAYAHEGIYSFNLYHSPLFESIIDDFSTKNGLEQVAQEYADQWSEKRGWEKYWTAESAMRSLRWSPQDSPHYAMFFERFDRAGEILSDIWEITDRDIETESTYDNIFGICVDVLVGIRQAGIFDRGVVLNIVCGDQSYEERVARAELINEPAVVAQYYAGWELDLAAMAVLRQGYARFRRRF